MSTKITAGLALMLAITGLAPGDVIPNPDLTKSAISFKKVFETVVEKANKATVDVLADGRRIAMGTVVSADGYILTKASELRGKLTVHPRVGDDMAAKIIGIVEDDDIAMIKVEAKNLSVIEWAAEKDVKAMGPGDWVAVPGTLADRPLAVGIVSTTRRKIAAEPGVLGVTLSEQDDGKGARVVRIMPGSGAERAGMKIDDAITSINGKTIKTRADLIENVRKFHPTDVLAVKVQRAGKEMELTITLGAVGATFSSLSPQLDIQNRLLGPVSKRSSAFPAVIQHDTVIQPRDCGGPLVNLDGKAVGVNIARAGRTESYAIPSDVVLPLVKDLIAGKYPTTPVRRMAPALPPPPPATSTAPSTQAK